MTVAVLLNQFLTLENCLLLAVILLGIGAYGVLTKRNLLTVLMSLEIMLNAVNIVLVAFNTFRWSNREQAARALGALGLTGSELDAAVLQAQTGGQVFVMMIIAVAAAEAAVGLAILVTLFRQKHTVDAEAFGELSG